MTPSALDGEGPDARLVQQSVERVEDALLAAVRVSRVRRRRVRIGLAALGGVALFAGGVAVGGAALAPALSGRASFTVDCYGSVGGHRTSSASFTAGAVARNVEKRPTLVCVGLRSASNDTAPAVGPLSRANEYGTFCGILADETCGPLYSANTFSQRPLIACRIANDHVAVYPLGKAIASEVCARARLTVWKK